MGRSLCRKGRAVPHPNETKIICDLFLQELSKEQHASWIRKRVDRNPNARFDAGFEKGLTFAEKLFRERFAHFLKGD